LAVPIVTCQSIYANTITGTVRLAVPIVTCQSIYANTITGTVRLAVPIITGQSIYADTITCQSVYTDTMTITSNSFRYVPWTDSNMTFSQIVTSTTSTFPTSTVTPTYIYSIIGNTMYVNFNYIRAGTNTSGTGYYYYKIPAGETISTLLDTSAVPDIAGSIVGLCHFYVSDSTTSIGWVIKSGTDKLSVRANAGNAGSNVSYQGQGYYEYGAVVKIAFEASFPIA
jgi:hypothetical protein